MSNIILDAALRTDLGKGASRRLRHTNQMPAIIYGGDAAPISIMLAQNKFFKAQEEEAFYSSILTIKIDGKEEKVIVKAMQRHSHKPIVNHADSLRVDETHVIHTTVPVHFLNEDTNAAIKAGGVISHNMSTIEVACLPANLPQFIEIDVAALEVDHTIHLSDVVLPEGVTSVQLGKGEGHDQAVVTIHTPKGETVTDEEASEEAPAAE